MKERIESLLKALRIEKAYEVSLFKSLLEGQSMTSRIEDGVSIYPIEYLDYKYDQFEELILNFKYNPDQNTNHFSQNGRLNLFSETSGETEEGIVVYNRRNEIKIQLNSKEIPDWIKKGKLGLNAICDTKTYDIQIQYLENILKEKSSFVKDFYNYKDSFEVQSKTPFPQLNHSQEEAANRILSDDRFLIIHGPPGTGKTKTLVTAIQAMASTNKKVMVAAPSNAAVDYITHQLSKLGINILRIGNSFKMNENVESDSLRMKVLSHPEISLVNRLKKEAEIVRKKANRYVRNFGKEEYQERKELRKELKTILRDIKKIEIQIREQCIDQASVITGTFIGLNQHIQTGSDFDTVFVDEAGQATEPLIWTVSHFSEKLILAGDPYQLPPTILTKEAQKLGLGISLIEKGMKIGIPKSFLDVQYRMNDKIMQFSNDKFYQSKLISDTSVKERTLDNENYSPIEFIDTAGCDFDEIRDNSGGIYNPGESEIIEKRLAETEVFKYSVGIISPYKRQINILKELFPKLKNNIETIDSFQGQERDLIILSLVRSNESGEIGFLKDYRRMNVAMTRAKMKLIIIGNSATLGADSYYSDLLNYIEQNGSYRSAWEYK